MLKLMRDPVHLAIKYLYPKLYRIDDILDDQSNKVEDPTNALDNIGLFDDNLGTHIRPYCLPLSIDYIDFDSNYILILYRFVFNR